MCTRDIKLITNAKFRVTNFSVLPEVLGAVCKFKYNDYEITITTPKECDGVKASVSARSTETDEISRAEVLSLDISMVNKGRVTVPVEILSENCNAYGVASDDLQTELENKIIGHQSTLNEAIDKWLRCLRWRNLDWRAGRYTSKVSWHVDASDIYLINREDNKKIWSGTLQYRVPGCKAISLECWNETETFLEDKGMSPVYYDLLFDSEAHLEYGELKRSLVEVAMAAEIFIRTLVEENIPVTLNSRIKEHLERVPIRTVFDSFLSENLTSRQKVVLVENNGVFKQSILDLFKDRNTIMHSGKIENLDRNLCINHINKVKRLIKELG